MAKLGFRVIPVIFILFLILLLIIGLVTPLLFGVLLFMMILAFVAVSGKFGSKARLYAVGGIVLLLFIMLFFL